MSKILLIYEDYTDLNTVQFTLKKVGFDCIGISTEFGTSEQVISFNPDIVIASGRGPKVSTIGVGRRLKEMPRWTGKAVLIFAPGYKPKPEELMKIRMDVVLEAPVENVRLIQVLAKLTHQDDQVLMERLIKTMAQENVSKDPSFIVGSRSATEKVFVGGNPSSESKASNSNIISSTDRKSDRDLAWSGRSEKESQPEIARVGGFSVPNSENSTVTSESTSISAFDDLNRREKAKARRRPQFSLTPEVNPEDPIEPRFGDLSESPQEESFAKKSKNSNFEDFEKKAEARIQEQQEIRLKKEAEAATEPELQPKLELQPELEPEDRSSSGLPVDKQQVDWSELENQLFQPNPKGAGTSEDPLESFGLDFMQQIRQAEEGLSRKMKNYQEMNASLRLPQQTTLKKTNSRKAQIELMKDWNQVELEKQDGLRREFTKALFKKKK